MVRQGNQITTDELQALLADEEQGRPLRALGRALMSCDVLLGGAQTRERFTRNVTMFVEAGDYGAAVLVLSRLCMMAEAGICPSCDTMLHNGHCPGCAALAEALSDPGPQDQDEASSPANPGRLDYRRILPCTRWTVDE